MSRFFGSTCLEAPNRVSLAKSDVSIVLGSGFWGYRYTLEIDHGPEPTLITYNHDVSEKNMSFSNQPNSLEILDAHVIF